ncbi:condensation domain-containing protein [Nocardia sp. NPDC059691]|uniref:condensation domain-containing protein n=1 Tax=Nocardia sp. NPDC059691 TaxID=3346908 RepID=UPI003686A371
MQGTRGASSGRWVPATFAQHDAFTAANGAGAYRNLGTCYLLAGSLSVDRLAVALRGFVDAHDALQVCEFRVDDGVLTQVIAPLAPEEQVVELVSVQAQNARQFEAFASRLYTADLTTIDDRAGARRFRFRLLRYSDDYFALLVTFQHLIFDGKSLDIFAAEIWHRYAVPAPADLPGSSFSAAATRQQIRCSDDILERNSRWWSRALEPGRISGCFTDTADPDKFGDPSAYETATIELGHSRLLRCRRQAADRNITMPQAVFGALAQAIFDSTTADALNIWTAVDLRRATERETVGMFSSMVPIRIERGGLYDCIRQTQFGIVDAMRHAEVRTADKIAALTAGRADQRPRGIDVYCNYQRISSAPADRFEDSSLRVVRDGLDGPPGFHRTAAAVHLFAAESDDMLSLHLSFHLPRIAVSCAAAVAGRMRNVVADCPTT